MRQRLRPAFSPRGAALAADQPDLAVRVGGEFEDFRREGLLPEAFIGGDDLLEAGLQAGPRFKIILEATYDAQLEGRVQDRDSALEYALSLSRDS